MAEDSKVMLIGVEGLSHRLLEALGERLPTLGSLLEESCCGCLRSTIPYTTAPAWTSMVTGVHPGRHGIYDFLHLDREHNLRVVRGSDCRARPLWRHLREEGLRSIIINVPPFYPAEDVDSAMIGSSPRHWLSVYPPSLEDEVRRRGYIIDVDNIAEKMRMNRLSVLEELLKAEKKRIEVAEYLLSHLPWSFSMIVFNFPDRLLHHLSISTVEALRDSRGHSTLLDRLLKRGRRTLRLIGDMFRLLDEFLSRCLKRIGGGLLIIASDHGMTRRPKVFLVNSWLREEGYIDHEKTRALCYSTVMPLGLIRLNLEGRERNGVVPRWGYEKLLDEIKSGLESLRDNESGERIIRRIWRGDELYGPKAMNDPPDLVFEVGEDYTVDPWRLEEEKVADASRPNDHERCGAFLIHGYERHVRVIEEIHDVVIEFLGLEP